MNEPKPSFEWQITSKCNYNCSYCCQRPYIKEMQHCSEETTKTVLTLLQELPGTWIINLVGGEPFIYPRFFDLCQFISESGHYISTTTNFSLPLHYFKHLIDITGDKLFGIDASLHLDQVKNFEHFVEKAVTFSSLKHPSTSFRVVTVCIEQKLDILQQLAATFDEVGVHFSLQHLKTGGKYITYSNREVEQFLNSRAIKSIEKIRGKNLFGTLCHTGELFFRIDVRG